MSNIDLVNDAITNASNSLTEDERFVAAFWLRLAGATDEEIAEIIGMEDV